jgi:hypothetical protein
VSAPSASMFDAGWRPVYAVTGVRMVRGGLIVLAAALALARVAGDARAGCQSDCQAVFDQTLIDECDGCAEQFIGQRDDCLGVAQDRHDACVENCPAFAGRCTITRECVDGCAVNLSTDQATCQNTFKHQVRNLCARGQLCLQTARAARKACKKECKKSPSAVTSPAPQPLNPCNCQNICIRNIVGSCYDQCVDRCKNNQTALQICRRGCRNAQCKRLENTCAIGGDKTNAYTVCCTGCNNCVDAVDCIPTTTSTSTSSTTLAPSTTTVTVTTTTTTVP